MPISDPPTGDAAIAGVYYLDYITDLGSSPPSPNFSSQPYYCTHPENLAADDSIGGIGNCTWEWSFTAKDIEGNPVFRALGGDEDLVHPWRSWFRLRCGTTVIMAGPIVATSVLVGDDAAKIAGQTWEAYFPRWQYPFDPRPDHVNDYRFSNSFIGNESSGSGFPTPAGLVYQCQNRDVALIAHDLLVKIRDSVADRFQFNFTDLATPVGITTNFQYTLGDDSGIDSTLNSLTGIGEGFDYWIGQDQRIRVGSPYRYGSSMSPTISYFVDIDTPGMLANTFDYQNNGIQGNHVLGRGAGLASQTQMGSAFGYALSQDTFSRLDAAYDYGDVRNQTQLDNLTKKSLSLVINPVRVVNFGIDPGIFNLEAGGFWSSFRKGVALYITMDTLFHQVNAPYRLRSWSLGDNEDTGNTEVQVSTDRIYAQVADFGNPNL